MIAHKSGVLDDWCAQVGRDPAQIERSVGVGRQGRPGTSAEALLAAGVTLFTTDVDGPDYDLGPLREWLEWRDRQNEGRVR